MGGGGSELTRLLPDLGLRVGELPPAAEADPDTERHRLHTAVADLLAGDHAQSPGAAGAGGRPLGRRSDPAPPAPARARRERADAACSPPSGTPRPTCRPTLSETLADLRRYDSIRLGLHGLSGDEVAEFVRSAAGEEPGPGAAALAAAIRELTDGNAFLVCELWRALEETGAVEVVDGTIRVTGSPAELGSPESVREVVSQTALPPGAGHQRPARAGGHGGGGVRARRGAPRRRPGGARAAGGARRGRAQRDDRGVPGPRAGVPVHARAGAAGAVRPAVGAAASGAPPAGGRGSGGELRRALPRGRWRTWRITSRPPRPSATRGAPWSTTCSPRGRPPRRWPTTRRRRGCAPRWRWGSTAPEERLEISLELGQASHRAGKALDALAAYRAAADIARELGNAEGLARAAIGYEDACWRPGMTDQGAVELLEEAALALGDDDCRLRAGLLGGLARALDFQGHHERVPRSCARTRCEMARRLGDQVGLASVLMRSYWSRGTTPLEEILAMLTEARDIGRELGNTEIRAEAMSWRVPAFVALCRSGVGEARGGGAAGDDGADGAAVPHPRGRALRVGDRALRRAPGRGRGAGPALARVEPAADRAGPVGRLRDPDVQRSPGAGAPGGAGAR